MMPLISSSRSCFVFFGVALIFICEKMSVNPLVLLAQEVASKKLEAEAAYNAVRSRTMVATDLSEALQADQPYKDAKAELAELRDQLEEEFKKLDKAALPTKTLEFYHARYATGLLYIFDDEAAVDDVAQFAEDADVLRIATLGFGNAEPGVYKCKKIDNTPVFYTEVEGHGVVFVLEYEAGIYVLFDNYSIERIENLHPSTATLMSFGNQVDKFR